MALAHFTALEPLNNTPAVVYAGCMHGASSWPCNSLPVGLDDY